MSRLDLDDYDYDLPARLIAQTPAARRTDSRLLVLDRADGRTEHARFADLPRFLRAGDLLVANDSRVLPARLFGVKEGTGGAAELLLLRPLSAPGDWEVLARPGRRLRPGCRIAFGGGALTAALGADAGDGTRIAHFSHSGGAFDRLLDRLGEVPLPPYIRERLADPERYQTVYARERGSVAAPTAGLHFTEELLADLRAQGVACVYLTLHVGLGTFRPVGSVRIEEHRMHEEWYRVGRDVFAAVAAARRRGGRVVTVGTTAVRALESAWRLRGEGGGARGGCPAEDGAVSGFTDIFIYPGFAFQATDALITNFHLPKSTLLMLVSALAGRERILAAYAEAIRREYRFFSFGDAMLIL